MVAMRWGAVASGQPAAPKAASPSAARATSPGPARASSPGPARATSPVAAKATSPGAAKAASPSAQERLAERRNSVSERPAAERRNSLPERPAERRNSVSERPAAERRNSVSDKPAERRNSVSDKPAERRNSVSEKPAAERRNFVPLKKEDLSIGEEIGKGRFKCVVRGSLRSAEGGEPRDVVVLQYVKSEQRRELSILALLANCPSSHAAVPEIHGAIDTGKRVLVVQERAVLGSMKAAISDSGMSTKLTQRHRLRACAQFARAMVFLETVHLVHADLSCRNILLTSFSEGDAEQTNVKVTDFGLAIVLKDGTDSESRKQPQATRWCAPETVAESKLSHRSDVWSMGTTLWELFSNGEIPWAQWQKRSEVAARLRSLFEGVAKGEDEGVVEDFPVPDGCSPATHGVVLSCLRVDEMTRPSFAEIAEAFEGIAMDPEEFPELRSLEEELPEPDDQEGETAEGEAEAVCDTSALPSEAETASDDVTFDAGKVIRPEGVSTPSTSATPTIPWWQADHLDATRSELFAGPKASAFAEALKDFLHSDRVKELLGDKAGLEALKEFLCSPHALELLTTEAKDEPFAEYVRQRTPKMDLRDPFSMQEVFSGSMRARRASAPPQRPQRTEPVVGMPVNDVLVPLSSTGLQAEPRQMQHYGLWTVLSLVSSVLLRRREFIEEADAWAAFHSCGKSPCMLRDPRGVDVASQSWLVVDTQPSQGYPALAQATLSLFGQPMPAWC